MKTKLATFGLMVLGLVGCSTNAAYEKAIQAPTPPPAQKVSIISDPPGARIEINNEYVGDAPLTVDWPFQSAFNRMFPIIVTATPIESGYVQKKMFFTTDGLPSRVLFQTNIQPVTNQ